MITIVGAQGQLGNRLFHFAHFMAFACENRVRVMYPGFHEYAHLFPDTQRDVLCRFPRSKLPFPGSLQTRGLIRDIFYKVFLRCRRMGIANRFLSTLTAVSEQDEILLSADPFRSQVRGTTLLMVEGWRFRDRENLRRHRGAIAAYFQPSEGDRAIVAAQIAAARRRGEVVVGIHIRRTDYARWKEGRYFFEFEVYLQTMRRISELFENQVCFIVCSDEKEALDGIDFPFVRTDGHIIRDMYSLAACDYVVGPPSTYSGWAAYVGDVPWLCLESRDMKIEKNSFKSIFEVWTPQYLEFTRH